VERDVGAAMPAAAPEGDFTGKTITAYIGNPAGGTYGSGRKAGRTPSRI
jgi:hypothetical protein